MFIPSKKCGSCSTEVRNLSVTYGNTVVLSDVSFTLHCGELVAIIGPNGAGKTTLLQAFLGAVPYTGTIDFTVRGAVSAKPRIGYVPQRLHIDQDSPVSVLDFVALGNAQRPLWLGIGRKQKYAVAKVLDEFNAGHLLKRKMGTLSGGEMQRVLLAMAMMPIPDVLLLDEPVSAIDAQGLALFYEIVCDVRRRYDVSILLVTHDLADVAQHADRMLFLKQSVLSVGKPSDILSNAQLMGKMGPSVWNLGTLEGYSLSVKKKDMHNGSNPSAD
jgi:zinc transport system ATP-binding protein